MGEPKQPVLFVGHGSPMQALAENSFTKFLGSLGPALPRPRAILAVSAHWETRGTRVLRADWPRTIHDFYGFPRALHELQYPAPGSPATADRVTELTHASGDTEWGLDHGTWSVLHHLFPKADVPVLQLSLNQNLSLREHYEFAKGLAPLRDEGVLILASGNVTHNLRAIARDENAPPVDWALEFDALVKEALTSGDHAHLFGPGPGEAALWQQAHPRLEHFLPLLYAAALHGGNTAHFVHEGFQHGSLSMRAVRFG